MPTFQYDGHAVHCVLGSVSSNSNNSIMPTSWIIFFSSGLNGLYAWFCRRSCWRACRSGWFSIFWINSRTLVLCACFTTECGSPGIRKSVFTSFSIVCSWLKLSWSTWELSGTFSVFVSIMSLLVLSCACSTLGSLLSSDERAWITLVRDVFLPSFTVLVSSLTTGLHVLSRLGFGIGWLDWNTSW